MARGYGIILVILGHLSLQKANIWIYSFHVPLFFFISGYLLNDNLALKPFIIKKLKALMIPYFSLGIIAFLLSRLIGSLDISVYDYAKLFIIQRRFTSMWFLPCIFLLEIFWYFLNKYESRKQIVVALVIMLTLMGLLYSVRIAKPLPWNIDVCFTAMPFFAVGYWLRKTELLNRLARSKWADALLVFTLLVNIVLSIVNNKLTGNYFDIYHLNYGIIPFTFLAAFAGILFVVLLSNRFTILPVSYIGANSMLYFALQQIVMIPIAERILNAMGLINTWGSLIEIGFYSLSVLLIVLIITTVFNIIISHSKLRFVIGK